MECWKLFLLLLVISFYCLILFFCDIFDMFYDENYIVKLIFNEYKEYVELVKYFLLKQLLVYLWFNLVLRNYCVNME